MSDVEIMRKTTSVVVNLDVQTVPLFSQSHYDTPTRQADEGVFDGVLHELVDDQRARRRLLGGQAEAARAFQRQVDRSRVIEDASANLGQDAIRHLVDVDDARLFEAQEFVYDGDGDDAADAFTQLIGDLGDARTAGLETQ